MSDTEPTVFHLSSLQKFFHNYEVQCLEQYSSSLVEIMRNVPMNLSSKRRILEPLKRISGVSGQCRFNLILVLAVLATEVPELEEKRTLTDHLISLVNPFSASSDMLEVSARALVNQAIEEKELEHKRYYMSRLETISESCDATPDVLTVYAQGIFNLMVDETEIPEKRAQLHRLQRMLKIHDDHGSMPQALISYGKALVNMAHFAQDLNEKRKYLLFLEGLSKVRFLPMEIRGIYGKGLSNHINDTDLIEEKRECLKKLAAIAKKNDSDWETGMSYASALFNISLENIPITEKRRYARKMQEIAEKEGCPEDVQLCCARGIFNQMVDETKLPQKKDCLEILHKLMERSEFDVMITREYARALVNITVDNPHVTEKRTYIRELKKLTEHPHAAVDFALEYTKGLTNLALCLESVEEKREALLQTLETFNRWKESENNGMSEETLVNFMCIYAGSLAFLVTLESDAARSQAILAKMPSLRLIRDSEYFPFVKKFLEEGLNAAADPLLRKRISEILNEDVHA